MGLFLKPFQDISGKNLNGAKRTLFQIHGIGIRQGYDNIELILQSQLYDENKVQNTHVRILPQASIC